MRKVAGPGALIPLYETHSFAWLLQRVSESAGRIVSAQVMHGAEHVGWFIYAIRANGAADVVQLAALPGRQEMIFDHLIHHAANEGVRMLRGRAERQLATILSDRAVPLTLGHPWTVLQSRRPDVAMRFVTGNVFFSRLDAEWWIGT